MKPILFSLFNASAINKRLTDALQIEVGDVMLHRFPDSEWYVKINSRINNRELIVVDSLNQPDEKILPLLFFAKTAKELGAKKIGLVAPYLPYLRQDKRFQEGEGVTSRYFAEWLSESFDWIMTIDPHLHRYSSLDELYDIPTFTLHAAAPVAAWIKKHVDKPMIIGPDMESQQWAADIAEKGHFPYLILEKSRRGDNDVAITGPTTPRLESVSPIVVDDIISTAATMMKAVKYLRDAGVKSVTCIGVHALFAENAYSLSTEMKNVQMVTCNTISHATNGIDVSDLIVDALVKNKLVRALKK
ncbi:ribose-phosphate diphosphokinase [Legionella sp. MW5194]|uniref:ribose-phosphate pyrophosphokinase n=1 Tax=Legionella sp. MW5194 TaxID=2662448 RepID=UPI00193D2F83|nr:ribose-phosphate pyrophosphokinase [Legionella sp. MW5194]QRN04613.1 ribose-phosphate diphosphokinase [Legionella sp. MW5194]